MSAQPEVWRVSTVEGIFETDLDTLKQWIVEGCVLPTDKVSKGNLSWIEAGRVPKLKSAFDPSATPAPRSTSTSFDAFVESNYDTPQTNSTPATRCAQPVHEAPPAGACQNPPDTVPDYVCRVCGALFCKDCVRFANQRVPICPLCGDLCREYRAIQEQIARAEFQSSGFGMEDFVRAIRYPLQHKGALVTGALIYAFLLMAGFRGALVAWMFIFRCIAHVISQVAWGRLNRSFMPDFSAFSLWDDLVVPVFLGVGIMIVTWGPAIALVIALTFGMVSSGGVRSSLAPTPAQSSGPTREDLAVLADPEGDPVKQAEANKKLQNLNPGVQIAHEAEQSKAEASDPLAPLRKLLPYLGASIFIVLLFLLFIAWGVFYYPMALTVAGYTQSFSSVVNPLLGLDTIRRMGTTYFKAFGMVIMVQLASIVVGVIVAVVTSPFALPCIGNRVG